MSSINKRVWEKRQREKATSVPSMTRAPVNFDYDAADTVRACTRKKAYHDEVFARRVARNASATHSLAVPLVAYACRHCGSWHIGRAPSA